MYLVPNFTGSTLCGNKKFDESAMKAVSKINFLQDVSDLSRYDFEKYFREIDLVFKSR